MTVAIAVVTPDGLVVAADSRTTWGTDPPRVLSDFTHKVFKVGERAVATYGWAFLERRNVAGHMTEFAREFGGKELTTEQLANAVADWFGATLERHLDGGLDERPQAGYDPLGFLVAGYDDSIGRSYDVGLPSKTVTALHDSVTNPGAAWRGQTDVVRRLVFGVDLSLLEWLAQKEGKEKQLEEVMPLLQELSYIMPFNLMNLQDAVDFAVFAIRTTIDVQKLTNGSRGAPGSWPGVGGPIEIAIARAADGFRWVQQTQIQGERTAQVD